ncbi:CDP-glycerol glycerophosphotransferase family protein [Eggerthellaceae bacterium 3-80]|nr:CDP-glycerol glycerophosphotransferase [bacterium D16-34]
MKRVAVKIAAFLFNVLYAICKLGGRRKEVLFVTRQADTPSDDFVAIGNAYKGAGYQAVFLSQRLTKRAALAYAVLVVREIYHLAKCQVCFVDRYDPVISLLHFTTAPVEVEPGEDYVRFTEVPVEPVVVQLWHAFGAFKKFGYQTVDTAEGHPLSEMELFKIHRNYSWVICSGEGARRPFAEAFGYPVSRVLPLGRPEYKELCDERAVRNVQPKTVRQDTKTRVLFAPTVRKYDKSVHPFADLYKHREELLDQELFEEIWSFHPLDVGEAVAGSVPPTLENADVVVTDYSSIVYEAYLLGKPVFFYTPDVDHYCKTPGLNINPVVSAPDIVALDEQQLLEKLKAWHDAPEEYPWGAFESFVGQSFEGAPKDPAKALVALTGSDK